MNADIVYTHKDLQDIQNEIQKLKIELGWQNQAAADQQEGKPLNI